MNHVLARAGLVALILALAGCDWIGGIFEDTSKTKLAGERVSVLGLDRRLEPDPKLAEVDVHLPPAAVNPDWPQAGGYPSHAMQHLALGSALHRVWRADVGEGASRYGRVVSQPVVAGGRLFAMDARDTVVAVDAVTGRQIWETDVKPEVEREHAFGGGLAASGGQLFVTTGYAQVLALDAATGHEVWRQQVSAPIRGAPTVADSRVFAVTVED